MVFSILLPKLKWSVAFTICATITFYSLAAYYLVYCIHHDEHFQILEFANFKRGLVGKDTLAWEYNAHLRSSIQPALAYILLNFMEFLKLTDPFNQAFVFRLLSSVFFLSCSLRLYRALSNELHSLFLKKSYFFFSIFFYTFPVSGTRFSSENISSCFFLIGFTILYPVCRNLNIEKIAKGKLLLIGLFFGFSFLFRYQSAILIAGLACWLLIYRHKNFTDWLIMFVGFCFIFLFGILLDRWFYDKWVFTSLNYLNFNVINGGSETFGVSPWYFYITAIDFRKWLIILNGSILLLIPLFLFINPKHPISWIFFPFLIVHSIIAHKETRFIYPILIYLPFIITSSIQFLAEQFRFFKKSATMTVLVLMIVNSFAFVAATFSVTDNSTEIFKFIRTLPDRPIKIYYNSPFFYYTLNNGSQDITPLFYKDNHNISMQKMSDDIVDPIHEIPAHSDTLTYIILDKNQQEKLNGKLRPVFDPEPGFFKILNCRNWMKQGFSLWKLYELHPQKTYTSNPVRYSP